MTTRRKFIQGAVSAAVAASLPGGDGVALESIAHPSLKYIEQGPAPVFLPFVSDRDTGMFRTGTDHLRLVVGGIERLSSLEEMEIEIDEHSKPLSRTFDLLDDLTPHRG